MAIVINGSGTVTGLAVGGLPDATVDSGTLASGIDKTSITDGGNATAMTITSAEKIGIGTATPICLVELEHSNTTVLSGDGDDSAINIHNTAGVNAISTISFSGGDHNGDGNLAGIYAKHTNVTENSETTDIGFKTSLNEVQVDNLILRGDRGLSQFTAKFWIIFRTTSGGNYFRDSHNVSSITDHAVGDITINLTNNMGNAEYVVVASVGMEPTNPSDKNIATVPVNAGAARLEIYNMAGTHHDMEYISALGFGD